MVDDIEKPEDLDLFYLKQWKDTGDKQYFQKLYRGMGGVLHKAMQRASYGSNVPQSVFKLEAAQQMHDALKRYNPDSGTKLSTFVFNAVDRKLLRVNYLHQNLARLPERAQGGAYHVGVYNNEKLDLQNKLGREPTPQELADQLGWPIQKVENMGKEIRRDLSLNAELEDLNAFDDFSAEKDVIAMRYYDMDPEEQQVFDLATGSHGKDAVLKRNGVDADFRAIAQKLGWPEDRVMKVRRRLVKKF